jgi:integrase
MAPTTSVRPSSRARKTKQWKPADRERVLTDEEIRAMWIACADMGAYGAEVRSGLLLAQRFRKVANMVRGDLKDRVRIQGRQDNGNWVPETDIGHVWDAARDSDPKNKRVSAVPLSRLAREVIAAVPVIDSAKATGFVFTVSGSKPLTDWTKYKQRLDARMLALLRQWASARGDDPEAVELKPWRHRDLRRTARTLMSRMGVDRKIAEHALAHVAPGVEKVYDRHDYLAEKRDAFAMDRQSSAPQQRSTHSASLAVNPPAGDNVVPPKDRSYGAPPAGPEPPSSMLIPCPPPC